MRSAKEQEEFQTRAFEKRQADLKKLEKEAARVAKQQAAAAAVASQNWQQLHKEAADVRHNRQKAVAQRQAARAHMAEAPQATRAISKAVAVKKVPVEAPVLQVSNLAPAWSLFMSPGGHLLFMSPGGQLNCVRLITAHISGQASATALCSPHQHQARTALGPCALNAWQCMHQVSSSGIPCVQIVLMFWTHAISI